MNRMQANTAQGHSLLYQQMSSQPVIPTAAMLVNNNKLNVAMLAGLDSPVASLHILLQLWLA